MLQMSRKAGDAGRRLVTRELGRQTREYSARAAGRAAATTRPSWKLLMASTAVIISGSVLTGHGLWGVGRTANDTPGSAAGLSSSATRGTGGSKTSISILTPVQVSSRLRELEESYLVDRGKGVVRYDISQLPSNNPIEDDRSERVVQLPVVLPGAADDIAQSTDWMFWGVYDGHSGWTTSAYLRQNLISTVIHELDKVYEKTSPLAVERIIPSPETIDAAIRRGFVNLDDDIVHKRVDKLLQLSTSAKAASTELIAPALSGSCGLLAFYDTSTQLLRIAVAGDSRAVLGSRSADGSHWTAQALSTDQTGSNPDEAYRVRSEHPGEEATAIRRGRVLGSLEPTRSFGDARYKWSREIQHQIAERFFGRRIPSELKTPPYVTADPVVTTTKISPENGDFLVMASDGLFEMLSNDEVVGLVVEWLKHKRPEYLQSALATDDSTRSNTGKRWWPFGGSNGDPSGAASSSSLASQIEDTSSNKDSQKQPIRRRQDVPVHFTVKDDNAATHLIRNALGGADQDHVAMLVSIPAPLARSYRDDLTVTVVFFGEDSEGPSDTGTIKVIPEATRSASRPKL